MSSRYAIGDVDKLLCSLHRQVSYRLATYVVALWCILTFYQNSTVVPHSSSQILAHEFLLHESDHDSVYK